MLRALPTLRRTLLLVALAPALLAGCGGDPEPGGSTGAPVSDAGPQHVHGLGVNPADGHLYIATHTGLWRARSGEERASRVGDVRHDLMGFTVAGPDRFLASGHPDGRHDLPPQLGLQRSTDAGRSWQTVSLLGEADLHVLRAAGRRLYAVDSGTGAFITSADGGESWEQRTPPVQVFDLAISPDDPEHVVAAAQEGLFASRDAGRSWRRLNARIAGLLAWPAPDALYVLAGDGTISRSADLGRRFEPVGTLGAPPEAFAANGERELYAGVHGGRVLVSTDGGRSWHTRSTP